MMKKCFVLMLLMFVVSMSANAGDVVADWTGIGVRVDINTTMNSSSAGVIFSTAAGDSTLGWGGWNNAQISSNHRIRWNIGDTVGMGTSVLQMQGEAHDPGTYLISRFGQTVTDFNKIRTRIIRGNGAASTVRWMIRDASDNSKWYASDPVGTMHDGIDATIDDYDVTALNWALIGSVASAALNTDSFPTPATLDMDNLVYGTWTATGLDGIDIDAGGFYIQTEADLFECNYIAFVTVSDNEPPTVIIPAVDPVYIQSYLDNGIVNLSAIATDENEPNTLSVLWEVTSLPDGANYSLTPDNELSISAQFDMVGTYTLTVTVNDGVNPDVTSDPVTVEVITNASPVVDAGPATVTVYLVDGGTLLLDGASVTDDGEPNGVSLIVGWDSVPATGVSFDVPSLVNATATFTETGTYVLTLSADDSEYAASDSITVTVEEKVLLTMALNSIEDTYTAKNDPDSLSKVYGTQVDLQARDIAASWARDAYIKFDVGAVPGNIRSATLRLQAYGSHPDLGEECTDSIYAATYGPSGEWGETTLTWNNDDIVWGDELGSLTGYFVGGTNHEFNVMDFVIESDGKVTLGMKSDFATSAARWKARESGPAVAPLLTIVYDPEQAVEVSPEDGSAGHHPGGSIIWQEAAGATAHEVYLGTTSGALDYQDTVLAAEKISTDPNLFSWAPAAELDLGTEYFWRIDEVFDGNSIEGEEWSFTVATVHPDIPLLISPANGKIDTVDPIEFSWVEGFAADSHDIYISTDSALVAALDDSVKIADVTMPYTMTNFDLETEYFWTVVATAASGGPWVSPDVYSFTTGVFATLDNFADGVFWVETPGTGADVNDFSLGAEAVMVFSYDDAGDVISEASLTFAQAMDLSSATGREALTLRVYGQVGNVQEDMYIALSDGITTVQTPVLFEGEPVDLTTPLYTSYEFILIDLDDFAPVNLSAVTSIAIGFGDGVSEGKSGTVYIDNVNVRASSCVSRYVDGDIVDADCIAGPNDLALIASDWLDAETTVTATAASTDGLIVQFDFEEPVDSNSVTSSVTYNGVNYATATVVDSPILGVAGNTGNAIDMASAGHVTIDDSATVLASLADEITVSMWCYGNVADLTGVELVKAGGFRAYTSVSTIALYSAIPDQEGRIIFGSAKMGGSWMSWEDSTTADWTGAWNHYAFVIDAANNFQAVYCNGVMVARDNDDVTGYAFDLATLDRFDIGTTPVYSGTIDDFRIYNRALAASEIADLAGKTSVTQGILSVADTNDDGKVNLVDFAEVASIWLTDEILWP